MNRDGDSGRYGSDWTQWSVEQMWQVLHGEDPDRTFRHADAWYDVMQACARHRDRLCAFRDQLTHRWSGTAADVYVARLDMLITGLDQTTEAAYTTYRALHTMASAITVAREKMAPLYAQWQRLDSQHDDYQNQWWIAQVFTSDPVTTEAREALNQPAREVMRVASDAIFQSYVEMTPAPEVSAPRDFEVIRPIGDGRGSTALNSPPVTAPNPQIQLPHLPITEPDWRSSPVLTGTTGPAGTPSPPGTWHDSPHAPIQPINGSPVPAVIPAATRPDSSVSRSVSPTPAAKSRNVVNSSGPLREEAVPGTRAGSMAWAPTTPVAGAGRRVSPAGGVIEGRGLVGTRGYRRARVTSDDGPFAIDASLAVQPVLEPDPEPNPPDAGPAIGLPR